MAQQGNDDRRTGDRDDGAEEGRRRPRHIDRPVGDDRRGDSCDGDPDGEEIANRRSHLGEPLRIEGETAFEEDDGHAEMDEGLERVAEGLRMNKSQTEGTAEDSEDEQRHDGRQLEPLGDDLAGNAQGNRSDKCGENCVHRGSIITGSGIEFEIGGNRDGVRGEITPFSGNLAGGDDRELR